MAATNKCLAQSNKSRTGGEATKKLPRSGDLGTGQMAVQVRRGSLGCDSRVNRPMEGIRCRFISDVQQG